VVTSSEREDSTWNDLGALAKLLAASLFNVRAPMQSQVLVPETCHSIAMFALMGSEHVRGAVAGVMTNLIQALLASRIDDPDVASKLKALLMRCCGPEVLRCFGLTRIAPDGNEYRIIEVSEIDSIENICDILLEAIVLGAPSPGTPVRYLKRLYHPLKFRCVRSREHLARALDESDYIDRFPIHAIHSSAGPTYHGKTLPRRH
jgi:hypothetical protein